MVAFANDSTMTVVVFETKKGLYVAMIPTDCDAQQIQSDLHDAKIEVDHVYELERWAETPNGICLAFLPHPGSN